MKFDISCAGLTFSTKWKRITVDWLQLTKKLKTTARTSETTTEYHRLKKDGKPGRKQQHKIKDVGGFVGGTLSSGHRKKSTILCRGIVTLDLDNVDVTSSDVWELFKDAFSDSPIEGCMYSTHSHTPDSPRLRLIIPLSREVSPAEYIPIGRKIADLIGIEMFDATTYQPERFMFWPSTPSDGEFIYKRSRGEFLNPDTILDLYEDPNDVNQWPLSKIEHKIISDTIGKQQDPTEKPGIIGAFCRVYSITGAIDAFLSNVYEPGEVDSRFTFIEGSSYNGLAVYDDKFAYSHHNTDPAGGQTCNSFDLVRLHKFGKLDIDVKDSTLTTNLPSYKAMTTFCVNDKQVRKQSVNERLDEAKELFADLIEPEGSGAPKTGGKPKSNTSSKQKGKRAKTGLNEGNGDSDEVENVEIEIVEEIDDTWKEKLELDKQKNVLCTTNNMLLIVTNDPLFKGAFAMDLFSMRIVAKRPLKWRGKHNQVVNLDIDLDANFEALVNVTEDTNRYIDDADLAFIRWYIETAYKMAYAPKKLEDAISVCAGRQAYHPIKDFLNGLKWDGVQRIKYLFHDYLGADNSPYTREVSTIFFTAAVSRVFRPGCKFDYMPVLIGEQGAQKSSFIRAVAAPWFSDSLFSMGDKSSFEQIQGSWVIEVAELSAMKKSDVDSVKHFISKPDDKYRPAFGRLVKNNPRTCVFFGTCNNEKFLKDDTGNRRFWPIQIGVVDRKLSLSKDFTNNDRLQIWAEAVELYKGGQKLYLSKKLELIAKDIQTGFTDIDERIGMVEQYINCLVPLDWDEMYPGERAIWYKDFTEGTADKPAILKRDRICAHEIAAELFQMELKYCTNNYIRQINTMLKNIKGLTPDVLRFKWYGLQRGFKF